MYPQITVYEEKTISMFWLNKSALFGAVFKEKNIWSYYLSREQTVKCLELLEVDDWSLSKGRC